MLVGTIFRLFGPSLVLARIITLVVSLAALGSFFWLCRSCRVEHPWLATGVLFLQPYIFANSFLYWVDIYALLFGIWVLYFYFKDHLGWKQLFLLGCALSAAILSAQWFVAYAAGIGLWWLYEFLVSKNLLRERAQTFILRSLVIGLSLLPAALVFSIWGGITHPDYRSHGGNSFQPHNIVLFFIVVGAHFALASVKNLKSIRAIHIVIGCLGIVLFVAFPPVWESGTGSVGWECFRRRYIVS